MYVEIMVLMLVEKMSGPVKAYRGKSKKEKWTEMEVTNQDLQ